MSTVSDRPSQTPHRPRLCGGHGFQLENLREVLRSARPISLGRGALQASAASGARRELASCLMPWCIMVRYMMALSQTFCPSISPGSLYVDVWASVGSQFPGEQTQYFHPAGGDDFESGGAEDMQSRDVWKMAGLPSWHRLNVPAQWREGLGRQCGRCLACKLRVKRASALSGLYGFVLSAAFSWLAPMDGCGFGFATGDRVAA